MGKASSMPVEKDKRMCQNFLDINTFEFSPCLMRFGINQSTEITDSMTCLKFCCILVFATAGSSIQFILPLSGPLKPR